MKLKSLLATALLALGIAFHANAAEEKHDHEHAAKVGPTNGKLLTEVEPHAEFLVTADRKVEIRFVDDNNKVVAPGTQVVTATLGERSKPTKLTFTKDGDKLVSDKTLPEGNNYPAVVQIKADAKAKAVNAKFNLNLSKCPTCSNAEYACKCDHGDDHDHKEGDGHDHDKKEDRKK
jgi:hypothetical protein